MKDHPLLGHDFFDRAVEFRDAYRALPKTDPPPDWPRYFLFCHAIELVLKAYLAQYGVPPITLERNFGHDLTLLLNAAIDLGLRPSNPETRTYVQALTEAHKKHWPRYPPATAAVFIVEQFEPVADDLFSLVRPAVYGTY